VQAFRKRADQKEEIHLMEKKKIYEFDRNPHEKVCVSRGAYRDRNYVDFRVFFTDPATGELKPTKKGITLAEDLLPQLKEAVFACEKAQLEELKYVRKTASKVAA